MKTAIKVTVEHTIMEGDPVETYEGSDLLKQLQSAYDTIDLDGEFTLEEFCDELQGVLSPVVTIEYDDGTQVVYGEFDD